MLKEEEKQLLERIVSENPEKSKLQQELQRLIDRMMDEIIERESQADEGNA